MKASHHLNKKKKDRNQVRAQRMIQFTKQIITFSLNLAYLVRIIMSIIQSSHRHKPIFTHGFFMFWTKTSSGMVSWTNTSNSCLKNLSNARKSTKLQAMSPWTQMKGTRSACLTKMVRCSITIHWLLRLGINSKEKYKKRRRYSWSCRMIYLTKRMTNMVDRKSPRRTNP